MALKDWHNVKTNKFQGTVSFTRNDEQDNVTIRFDTEQFEPWEAVYGRPGEPKFKRFKTKSQALAYAKSYMRSH